jgi:predicted  nucleic acid-binding Zn-ribbon protein
MIFSLSMMDVFCCTLGCVILLWLINQREAMLRTRAASQVTEKLTVSEQQKGQLSSLLDDLDRQLAVARAELKAQAAQLAAARSKSDDLSKQLSTARDEIADAEDRLAKKSESAQQLTRLRDAAKKRVTELEQLLRDKELQNENASRRVAELTERLESADTKLGQLRKMAETLPELQGAITSARERESTAEARAKDLERELAAARAASTDLSGRLAKVAAAADQRFEGIALTGRNVVFLVDMSGSMDLVDEKTPDAAKWVGVRETVQKIMRSLPQLERYQVILFSDHISYLMGSDGRWLIYDAKATAEKVGKALAATPPKGNTNMYMALEAAFQLRAQGLDTIYLLSDGLPNVGEGLTADQARTMTETQRTDVLSRTVRNALKTRWNAPQTGRPKVRINAVGFFYESPDVGAFLWALARENDGSFVGMSKP